MKLYLKIIFLILCCGCIESSKQEYANTEIDKYFTEFPENVELSGSELYTGIDFLYPVSIDIYDTLMVIHDRGFEDSMLLFFNTKDYQYLGSAGRTGNGPGEFIGLDKIDVFNFSENILAFDVTKSSLININIDSAINFKNYIPNIILNTTIPKLFDFEQINDTTFITSFYGEDPRLFILNWNLDTLDSFLPYPPLPNSFNLPEDDFRYKVRGNLYQTIMEKNIERQCIVLAYPYTSLIQVVDYKSGKNIVNIIGPENNFPPKYKLTGDGYGVLPSKNKNAYGELHLTNEYIFAIYKGKPNGDPKAGYGEQIFQFNWEGKPIRKYTLDRSIASFFIDESNNKMYGLDHFSDTIVVVWDFKF